jgi:hypothetical protein
VISRLDKQVDFVLLVLHVLFVLEASYYLFNLNILFDAQNSILDKIIVPFCLVHFSRQVVNLNHSKILLGHLCKPGFPPKPTSVAVISRLDKQVDFVLFVLHVLFVLEASHYLFNLNILFDVI